MWTENIIAVRHLDGETFEWLSCLDPEVLTWN